jgi:hypothetical protein
MGKEKIIFEPQKSVDWYDPRQLVKTGVKVLISSIFGDFNDKRELQAALNHNNPKKYFDDFSKEKEVWIDYVADTGDGFDSTFTIAKLLSEPKLVLEGQETQTGQILIMGGDQVYPVASREEYKNRLRGPYSAAFPFDEKDKKPPHIFAIPGNHDWYDGLTSFLKIFGQKRSIGNLRTQQARSYFALSLPHNVWLFGIDVQLNSDVDFNQVKYFEEILENEVKPESKVILCTAEPSWIFKSSNKADSYNNLEYFENKIKNSENATQVLTLAGDLHHYASYKASDGTYKITAGGGGAFMHPTQNLPDEISNLREGKINLQKTFPSSKDSKKLLFRNLWFAFSSWKISAMIGAVYVFVSSLLNLHFDKLENISIGKVFEAALINPFVFLTFVFLILGLMGFSDTSPNNSKDRSSVLYSFFGFFHGAIHTLLILFVYYNVVSYVPEIASSYFSEWLIIQGVMFGLGSLIGGSVFGLYLIMCNLFLKNHDNEAYSSLKWTGYKNFIRLHITEEEIKIYPCGVKSVQKWTVKNDDPNDVFTPDRKVEPELIENIDPIKLS